MEICYIQLTICLQDKNLYTYTCVYSVKKQMETTVAPDGLGENKLSGFTFGTVENQKDEQLIIQALQDTKQLIRIKTG